MYVLLAAPSGGAKVTVVFIIGLVIAGALVWAVRVGMRVMDREPDRPAPTNSRTSRTPAPSTRSARCANPTRSR